MINIEKLQQAINLSQSGKLNEAESLYKQLLEENPNEYILLSAVGLYYVNVHNYDSAIKYLKMACDIKQTLGTVSALGIAQNKKGDYENSVRTLEHALTLGENVDIYDTLIHSLLELKYYQKAETYTDKMIELYPENPKAIANKVKLLTKYGKLIEAEQKCVEYLKKDQNEPALWYHLGLLKELIYSDDKSAIECYKISGEQGNLNANYNIAVAYQKLGEYTQAEKYYKKYLRQIPDSEAGIVSLGMCYLTQKKFKEGYELLYKRQKEGIVTKTNNLWKEGNSLDKDLILLCDQGYGDHIQFMRYIPFLSGHNIKVAGWKQLKSLFTKTYPNIEYINLDEINPDTQAIRITDLAYVLNMDFDNIPFAEGYINFEPADIKNKKLKVGLCWEAGAAGARGMINRSIFVRCFEPLFNLKNIQLYSFQVTDTFDGNKIYADKMINLAKDFKDFSDTAKALKSMDIVVSVDTCVAHLAGALGVKTCLLLPYAPDWRWFGGKYNSEIDTPWYKSVEIFKQDNPVSWEKQINNIIEKHLSV